MDGTTSPTVARPADAVSASVRHPYRTLTVLLLFVGLACRLGLYLLNHPIYVDEAFLAINLLDRDYLGLTTQLDEFQVAPLLFLWAEKWMLQTLGSAEWIMRLVPLLAGVTALVLFWRLARRVASPQAAAVAVGLLAVSRWPVHMSSQIKPYSLDLLSAVVLLTLALNWLRRPERVVWVALLVAFVPFAIGLSYPAVFVAGGVAFALAFKVWTRRQLSVWLLFLAYVFLLFTSFWVFDLYVGHRQAGTPDSDLHKFMHTYWVNAFPPHEFLPLAKWLFVTHFGPMMGYPYGNGEGVGALVFPLFLAGAWGCWRTGRWNLLLVCLAPFALTLAAAFADKYPYGGCCRLSQHLAPAICLLAGVGFASLSRRAHVWIANRRPATWCFGWSMAVFAAIMFALWVRTPYRDLSDQWSRTVADEVAARAHPGDRVDCTALHPQIRSCLAWNLHIRGMVPVHLKGPHGADPLARTGPIWLLGLGGKPPSDLWTGAYIVPPANLKHQAAFALPEHLVEVSNARQADLWVLVQPASARK